MVGAMGADIAMRDAARRARYGRRGWPGRVNKPSRRSGRDAHSTAGREVSDTASEGRPLHGRETGARQDGNTGAGQGRRARGISGHVYVWLF